jgi:hypothetical protein
MPQSLQQQDRHKERVKLAKAAAASGVTAGLFLLGAPYIGAAALVFTGYAAYDWFMFRAKRGMRF